MDLLSLAFLIDSPVFMSDAKGSISFISRAFGACCHDSRLCLSLTCSTSPTFLICLLFRGRLVNLRGSGTNRHLEKNFKMSKMANQQQKRFFFYFIN